MKVLVTGANGQLGYDVCRELTNRGIENKGVDVADFDLTDAAPVRACMRLYRPDAVIHCAAWTAVDRAEDEPERAKTVNVDGTRNVALACQELGAKMLYLSTDYVFSGEGQRFYEPDDLPGPLSTYGATKLAGECAIQKLLDKYFIVRTSWVFGAHGNNFVKTMLRLAETHGEVNVVCDQIGSPTYTVDLAQLLCSMIETDQYGVYHATNEGVCSWAEYAMEIFRIADLNVHVNPVQSSEYPAKAVRPLNSRMSKDKLERNGFFKLPDWHDALQRFMHAELLVKRT